jgi:hypothetical protein
MEKYNAAIEQNKQLRAALLIVMDTPVNGPHRAESWDAAVEIGRRALGYGKL